VIATNPEAPPNKTVTSAIRRGLPVLPVKFLEDLVDFEHSELNPGDEEASKMEVDEGATPAEGGAEDGKASERPQLKAKRTRRNKKQEDTEAEPESKPDSAPADDVAQAKDKGKKKELPKREPQIMLRFPKKLKESGMLLHDSEPGYVYLPLKESKKRKAEGEESESKRIKLAPKPGSELLKVGPFPFLWCVQI